MKMYIKTRNETNWMKLQMKHIKGTNETHNENKFGATYETHTDETIVDKNKQTITLEMLMTRRTLVEFCSIASTLSSC